MIVAGPVLRRSVFDSSRLSCLFGAPRPQSTLFRYGGRLVSNVRLILGSFELAPLSRSFSGLIVMS